jgi:hypothetical protein
VALDAGGARSADARPAAGDEKVAGLGLVGPPTSALRVMETGGSNRLILRVFPSIFLCEGPQ